MSVIVTLKKGEGRTVKAGGMWIYDNEIESVLGSYENGDVVTLTAIRWESVLSMTILRSVCGC